MKNLNKFNVIFLVFIIIFSSQSIAADRILPLAKPTVDKETKIITAKKKEIYPQKKPVTKKVIIQETQEETIVFFEKAITTGLNSHTYYVPMSTLQIAIEYERIGENKKAKSYYNKCLNIKGFNYERGIHQKAKAGLERISN